MTRTSLLALPLVAALAVSVVVAGDPLAIGAAIPDAGVKMMNVDGRELSIAEIEKPAGTLVVFTCNHCPFAKAWESRIVALGNAYQGKGLGVVAINPNDPKVAPDDSLESMKVRAKENGMRFPYVVDGTSGVARAFGAKKTPEAFVFDKNGKLVYHGAIDDAQDPDKVETTYLKNALDAVLAGSDVAVKETKSIGCSIKFRS